MVKTITTPNYLTIKNLVGPEDIVNRLYDLGLYPNLEIEIMQKISFNSVTIVQFNETILALNKEEMLCLLGS